MKVEIEELHMYIDKGMSAEQIAKKMKLDIQNNQRACRRIVTSQKIG